MALKGYIAKRVLYSIILIFAVLTVNFLIFALMPGDPLDQYVAAHFEAKLTPEDLARLRASYGLDKPLHERYVQYLITMLTWNFGRTSILGGGVSVSSLILERLPNTLILMGLDAILSIIVGILIGVIVAYKRGSVFDTAVVTTSLITYSVPIFFIGWLLIFFFVAELRLLPSGGIQPQDWGPRRAPVGIPEYILGRATHLVLPTLTLFLFSVGGWILLTRAVVLETITEDYVVTARAKGLSQRSILYKHILKNASLPLITNVALTFGFIISGAIITETLFRYNGMGLLIWEALHPPDLPLLQAIFFVIALCVIVANFIADLLYGVVDPRVKYG